MKNGIFTFRNTSQTSLTQLRLVVATFLAAGVFSAAAAEPSPLPVAFTVDRWTDANKLHDHGNWGGNYFEDSLIRNGRWDYGEPFADYAFSANTIYASDASCWMASAANMLSLFIPSSAEVIYEEIMGFAATKPQFEWDMVGFQHVAIAEYLRVHDLSKVYQLNWYSDGFYWVPGSSGWPDDPFDATKHWLYKGSSVGLGLDNPGHALTFWGWTEDAARFADSAQFADPDQGEVNLHSQMAKGDKENWWLDYNGDAVSSERVRYLVTLRSIPEPETSVLLVVGGVSLLLQRLGRAPRL